MTDETITAPETSTATTATTPAVTPAPIAEKAADTKVLDPKTMTADQMKDLIENPPKLEEEKKEVPAVTPEAPKEEEWFDKEHGFKTKEDMLKSYKEAQNAIRERSEQLKEHERFRLQAEEQLAELAKKAETTPLNPQEAEQKVALEQWREENKDSLEFVKNLVKEDLRKEAVSEQIQTAAVTDRQAWKQEFDKDEARKTLWPTMESIYQKQGNKMFQQWIHNPFPVIEALAFKESFPTIAARIKQEAVDQYKAEQRQAAEVAKGKSTATPGGMKIQAGETDVSKMSADQLAALLPRGE